MLKIKYLIKFIFYQIRLISIGIFLVTTIFCSDLYGFTELGLNVNTKIVFKKIKNEDQINGNSDVNLIHFEGAGGRKLRVEITKLVKENESIKKIESKILQLKSIFITNPSPYQAMVTNTTMCPKEYVGRYSKNFTSGTTFHIINFFSNDRLTYGACSKESAAFKTSIIIFYCENNQNLYQVEYFIPVKTKRASTTDIENSIKCLK